MASDDYFTPMLTVTEVAHLLSIHENTVRRWSNRGILKPHRVGPRSDRRFIQRDITRFVTELHRYNGDERRAGLAT